MPTLRVPLFGSLTNRNVNPASFTSKDQRFENCFPEVVRNPLSSDGKAFLNKRTGAAATSQLGDDLVGEFGACVWSGAASPRVVMSFRDSVTEEMEVRDSSGTIVGAAVGNVDNVYSLTETKVSNTAYLIAILEDATSGELEAWYFPNGETAWEQISDGQFPSSTLTQGDPVYMDGYMFVITTAGRIHNSDLNSITAWSATSFIDAQSMPDGGVALARYRNLIAAFGKSSTEFFYNAGNTTGSPLLPVSNAQLRIGALDTVSNRRRAVQPVGNTVYWIGTDADTGSLGAYRLNGFQAEKVSNPDIDKLLNEQSIVQIMGTINLLGMSHVLFSAGAVNYCFCVETNSWWILKLAGDLTITAAVGYQGDSFVTVSDNGRLYSFGSALYQDNGNAYTMTVQTDNMDTGTDRRKFWTRLRVVGDRQAATSNLGVAYSDDDFANYSTAQNIDLSTVNNSLSRLGSSRRRSWKLTHAANTPCRLEAMELDYEVGEH